MADQFNESIDALKARLDASIAPDDEVREQIGFQAGPADDDLDGVPGRLRDGRIA